MTQCKSIWFYDGPALLGADEFGDTLEKITREICDTAGIYFYCHKDSATAAPSSILRQLVRKKNYFALLRGRYVKNINEYESIGKYVKGEVAKRGAGEVSSCAVLIPYQYSFWRYTEWYSTNISLLSTKDKSIQLVDWSFFYTYASIIYHAIGLDAVGDSHFNDSKNELENCMCNMGAKCFPVLLRKTTRGSERVPTTEVLAGEDGIRPWLYLTKYESRPPKK